MPGYYAQPEFYEPVFEFADRTGRSTYKKSEDLSSGRWEAAEQFEKSIEPVHWSNYANPGFVVDLHGLHPDDIFVEDIEEYLRKAHEHRIKKLTFVHGHGFSRSSYQSRFVNSNTGYLGQTVRSILRHETPLREWMYAKFLCSHSGSTTVRLR